MVALYRQESFLAPEDDGQVAPAWPGLPGATGAIRSTASDLSGPPVAGTAAAGPAGGEELRRRLAACLTLDDLAAVARDCRRCPLREGARQVVFGEGDPHARLMLVGEGPGATEDELGRPFVGKAGELLDRILAAAGFRRDEVYITNVVMCRPPGNRVPTEREMAACLPYLHAKIGLIRPRILVCLGSTAARALIDPQARITQVRGRWFEREGVAVTATYHPAALLRDVTKKRPAWEDFQAIRDRYRALAAGGAGAG